MSPSIPSLVMFAFLLVSSLFLTLLASSSPLELSIHSIKVAGLPSRLAANHSLVWTSQTAPVSSRRLSSLPSVPLAWLSSDSLLSPLLLPLQDPQSALQRIPLPGLRSPPRPLHPLFEEAILLDLSSPLVLTYEDGLSLQRRINIARAKTQGLVGKEWYVLNERAILRGRSPDYFSHHDCRPLRRSSSPCLSWLASLSRPTSTVPTSEYAHWYSKKSTPANNLSPGRAYKTRFCAPLRPSTSAAPRKYTAFLSRSVLNRLFSEAPSIYPDRKTRKLLRLSKLYLATILRMFPNLVPSAPLAPQRSTPPTSPCPPLRPNINPARAFLRSQDRRRIAFTYSLSPSHWSDCSLRSSKRFDDAVGFAPQSAFPSPRDLLLSSYFAASYSSFITSPLSRFLCRCSSATDDHVSAPVPPMSSKEFDSPSVSSPSQPRHSSLPFDCVRLPQPHPMSLFVLFSFTPFVLPPRSPFTSSNVHLIHQGPGCSSDDSSNGPAVPHLLSPLTALNQPVWSKQPHHLPSPPEPHPDHRLDDSSVTSDLFNNSYASYAPYQYVASVLHLVDSLISPGPSSRPSVSTFLSATTTPLLAPSAQQRVRFAEPYLSHPSSSPSYTRPPGYPRSSSGKRSASRKRSVLLGHHATPPFNTHHHNYTSHALPSFAKSSDPRSLWFFDNAASFSTTNDASLLYDITNCPSFPIGGINDGV